MNNYTQLHNGDYYTSEYYHIYEYIINKYKRPHIMWPLPKEIIFKPLMTENEFLGEVQILHLFIILKHIQLKVMRIGIKN